jgi:hypothetical protein
MGIDACIYVKMRDGVTEPRLEQPLPDGFKMKPNPELGMEGATHEVDNYARFYGPGYARGPWPTLSAALMLLLNSPDIETVWYCGDSGGEKTEEPWTTEKQAEYTAYFIAHGCREYRGPWLGAEG